VPGVARAIKKFEFLRKKMIIKEKKCIKKLIFSPCFIPDGTHVYPQKMSANLVQPFGQLLNIQIYEQRALLYRQGILTKHLYNKYM